MHRSIGRFAVARASALALAVAFAAVAGCDRSAPGAGTPEEVVTRYLGALKSGNYSAAYDLLSPFMVREQGKVAWVAEQTALMNLAAVEILSFEVFPAKPDGDKAVVPNLLISKDKYINQTGANEYELYFLSRGPDGGWRIDQQQLVETDAVANWFPERVRERR